MTNVKKKKKLSDMSLDELWHLFPISLVKHNDDWKMWYKEEYNLLCFKLPDSAIINHIGSTSIPNIYAKSIVDILVEVDDSVDFASIKEIILNCGYRVMFEEENRMSFNKGYTESGFADKVFHLHLRQVNDNDELYFKEYLIHNENVAKMYEKLKLELWKKYEFNRNGYTNAKTDFIKKYTNEAKQIYKNMFLR